MTTFSRRGPWLAMWRIIFAGLLALFFLAQVSLAIAANKQIRDQTPSEVSRIAPLGRLASTQQLNLAIGLPVRNQDALTEFLRELSDPTSPNYRHYLTPAQFTEQFGPTEADYAAVVAFAKAKGLKITNTHSNRMILDVQGSTSTVETAFNVKMMSYQHPTEARKFYAPDAPPTVEANLPILDINGLSNYSLPQPHYKLLKKNLQPAAKAKAKAGMVTGQGYGTTASPSVGSGPSGAYMGSDFRNAYAPNVSQTGTGQTVGLLQFDGYTTSDITYYEALAGLPNVPLTNVLLDGFTGAPSGNGGEVEVSLDIEMAMSMAPNLSGIIVYEAGPSGNWHDILNQMAMDDLASQLSCSWYIPSGASDPIADQIFQEMSAQGQSFFSASGDYDAFTGLIPFPDDSPYITLVGGTMLTMNGTGASYSSEAAWNRNNGIGTGGGVSTQYAIPTWQQSVSMASNQGSTTMRNVPDVALTAEDVYVRVDGGDDEVGGTSCASPLWAGFMALVNQQAKVNTGLSAGFINPAVYALGLGSNYTSAFHDTTTGNNFWTSSPSKFSAATGYDLATGWGSPNGSAMITALAGASQPTISTASPLAAGVVGSTYTQTFAASGGLSPYTWSVINGSAPAGLNLSTAGVLSGSPTSSGTATFTVQVTDQNNNSSSTIFSLSIYPLGTPVVATTSPLPAGYATVAYTDTLTATGGAAPLSWVVASGSLPSGLNLSTSGVISGTPTTMGGSTFTVQVTDSNGLSSTAQLSLTINAAPQPPTIATTSPLPSAKVGTAYTETLTASGGKTPYSWAMASGALPPGLGLSASGVISGTPVVATTSSFSVRVTGGNGLSSTASFLMTVAAQGALIPNGSFETDSFLDWVTTDTTEPFVPLQVVGNGYSPGFGLFSSTATDGIYSAVNGFDSTIPGTIRIAQDVAIPSATSVLTFNYRVGWDMKDYTGSTVARTFSVTIEPAGGGATLATFLQLTALPGTETLDTGALSGTVNLSAYAGTTVRVCFDCVIPQSHTGPGFFELDNVRLVSSTTPVITTNSPLPNGAVGSTYSQALAATGGTAPYSWSLPSGGLPTGLTLSSSGVISGTPTSTGTASFVVQVASVNGQSSTKAFGLTINPPSPPTITTTSPLPTGTATFAYTEPLAASGGITPYSWSLLSGSLPTGLNLSQAGVISGTPSSSGTATFVVQVAGGGLSSTGTFSLTINPLPSPPVITSALSATGFTTAPFSYQITATNNPTSFGASGLPPGISVGSSGYINGTPTSTGTFNATISAGNLGGTGTATLVITVTTPPPAIVDSLTALASFTGTNGNGATSLAGLVLGADGNFYGTTDAAGSSADGTVFKMTPTGSITTLVSFNGTNGVQPRGSLIQGSDGSFYGTTYGGGTSSDGTVFKITPSGSLTTLYSFNGTLGAEPYGALVQGTDGNFYGTTAIGGVGGDGTVFQLTPGGTLTSLFSFNFSNGYAPQAGLVQGSDGSFYGTTGRGGVNDYGTVFKITSSGSFTLLHSFTGTDGEIPEAALIQGSDGNFYGTNLSGGSGSNGTVFKITPSGTFTTLCSFITSTGENPYGGLIQGNDGNFYGTAYTNGNGWGTVYEVTPAGALSVVGEFNSTNGSGPESTLIVGSDGSFYGTTTAGGSSGDGVVFKCSPLFLTVTVGNALNFQIAATNSPTGYGASGLPSGVSVNTATGLITGTPTVTGTYNATISASNGGGTTNAALTIAVVPAPPAITSLLTASGTAGVLFTYQITASNNPASFNASGLPAGLGVNTASGMITGTPATGGVFNATISATNAGGTGSATLAFTIQGPPTITNGPPPAALFNAAYGFTYTTTGFPAPSFSLASGALPPGLILSTAGTISGAPTAGGTYTGTVSASNGIGTPATQGFSITVDQPPAFTDGPPPSGAVSASYSFAYTASGFPAPTFSMTSGALPPGLTLSSAGAISGAPTTAGTYTGVVTANNGIGTAATQNFSITIVSLPPPVLAPEPPTTLGSSNTVTWASVAGAVQYEVEAATNPNFTSVIDSGWLTGTTYTFNSLSFGTTYYFRVRARTASTPDASWSQTTETAFSPDILSNVVAETGNLFIADSNNDTIRQMTTANFVSTFAGTAGQTGSLDAQGTAARFSYTSGGAFDAAGNLYIADANNDTIRKIAPDGTTSTFAGLAGSTGSADGKGGAARFYTPYGLAFDSNGNLFVADRNNYTIRKITPDGTVSTFAGLAGVTGSTDGAGSSARFNWPAFPAVDRNNNVYIADQSNSTIRKITPTGTVTTLAGSPGSFSSGDGVGSAARFNNPSSVAVDAGGNLYVTDNGNSTIRKITPTGTVTTFAGVAGSTGSADGTGSTARFNHPHGIAVDGNGNIYVTDNGNDTVRKITPTAGVATLAGSALSTGSADGSGSAARFNSPGGVAINDIGGMVLAETGGVYVTSGNIVSTVIAPSPFEQWGVLSYTDNVSGSGTAVTVDVLDSNGNLLAAAVPSGTDLSTLPSVAAATSIELRANLLTTNTANTPIFESWSVAYFAAVFSGWSGTISSTQTQPVAPVITSTAPPSGIVGTIYNFTYDATGNPSPTFSLTAGILPPGLTLGTSGVLSGMPTTSGSYTGTVTATNSVSPEATQNFSITIQSTFNSWAAQYFSVQQMSDPTVSGTSATPQNDGVINLLKYIYDINPTRTMTAADMAALPVGSMTTIAGQKYLCLTYRQNALMSGYTISLQSAPDLRTWTTVIPDLSQQIGTDPVTGDPIMRIGVNVTGSSQEFLRLSVTTP
jgi:uncharacterized repeat protein (TIGR03803 family)